MPRWSSRRRTGAGQTSGTDQPAQLPIAGADAIGGLVLATYSEALCAWTAVVVTHGTGEDPLFKNTACVLELDWFGAALPLLPEVASAPALRLTHHAHSGRYAHSNHSSMIPRNYVTVGVVVPPGIPRSNSFTPRWNAGYQLSLQRRWDAGDRGPDPNDITTAAADLASMPEVNPEAWRVKVTNIRDLDAREVAVRFPNASEVSLRGEFGQLTHANALNELRSLKLLSISDLFGMGRSDCLTPTVDTKLEALYLHNVPAEYATATRQAWKLNTADGTTLEIRGARSPEWLTENRDNPLREWDTREHISPAKYEKAIAQYRQTRDEVRTVLSNLKGPPRAAALKRIGAEYAIAFNRLDGTRSPFIETEEREELFVALEHMVNGAGLSEQQAASALAAIHSGVESTRAW